MAWTETFRCNVCNKEKNEESTDWWLTWTDCVAGAPGDPEQQVINVTPWNGFLAHSAQMGHLCGARCVHTMMDRWMLGRS